MFGAFDSQIAFINFPLAFKGTVAGDGGQIHAGGGSIPKHIFQRQGRRLSQIISSVIADIGKGNVHGN